MNFTHLRIENYKGLREIDIPLSRFVCLIGENNVGKSSVLQAMSLFFSGTALAKSNFFDETKDVRIEIALSEIEDADLDRLAPEHREKIRAIAGKGRLTLLRLYGQDGKSGLKYRKLHPTDLRFSDESVDQLLKERKPGKALVDAVVAQFPELKNVATTAMNKGEVRSSIEQLADELPDDQKTLLDADLPTGIDKSISAMLPEPIYIPAVKDLKDDVKTTESTPFGRILGILLKAIEPSLAAERTLFDELNAKLNRVVIDGQVNDNRLDPVKEIEKTVQRYVQESFKAVTLRITIPPPELKTVLSSAVIYANDGVDGPLDTKGDGLRRAIVFAVIRSYVELRRTGALPVEPDQAGGKTTYMLLFEEPELYLYPKAQEFLFDALRIFSQKHRIIVTTHSPLFFGPQATTTFVKMRKTMDRAISPKPFGMAHPVDLGNADARDQFQIICYENNNIAFFTETVVLVEGDSDYIALPHLARVINLEWDCRQLPVAFARIQGKGNIRRYKEFFGRFHMRVLVVTDLDFLLGSEFGQIDPSGELRALRDQLLSTIDAVIKGENGAPGRGVARVVRAEERPANRALWHRVRELEIQRRVGKVGPEIVSAAMDEVIAADEAIDRADVLKGDGNGNITQQKRPLLDVLRAQGVYVLEKGAIEDYYPQGVTGGGKPARAQCFCNMINTRELALPLCNTGHRKVDGGVASEFEAIFHAIFEPYVLVD